MHPLDAPTRTAEGVKMLDVIELKRRAGILSALEKEPQSFNREVEITRLKLEVERLTHKLELRVTELASLLFESYLKTGSMRAILPDGGIIEGRPTTGVNPVQDVWNILDKARSLAHLSVYGE